MSKPPKVDKRIYVRCPYCGKQPVQVKRDHLVRHLTPGGIKCMAVGVRLLPSQLPMKGKQHGKQT